MIVLLGALFLHTVSTSEALVRENASITFGSCPVLIGTFFAKHRRLVLDTIGTSRALV